MSVTFSQLKTRMPALLASGVSLHLRSAPGVGKSEFVDQTIADLEKSAGEPIGVAKLFVATASPIDLLGYMIPGYRGEKRISEFTEPLWMQTYNGQRSLSEFRKGVLVLEEFGQGEGEVKRASADLFLNKRVGPHRLPDGFSIIALSNRAKDRSGVTKDYDFRINREASFDISPDVQSWEDWANKANVHPVIKTFAIQNPQIVFDSSVPAEQGPWCTPRSLIMTERLLTSLGILSDTGFAGFQKEGKGDAVAYEATCGTIGVGAAAQLAAMIMLAAEMPKFSEIVAKPKTAKLPTKPDASMLVCYQLASRVNEETIEPVAEYVQRMPREFTVMFGKSAIARDPSLINTKAFSTWIKNNSSLMMAISA